GGRQRRLRTGARGGDRPGRAGARQRFVPAAVLEVRDEQARGEGVPRAGRVDDLDLRRRRACDGLAVLEEHGSSLAERQGDEPGRATELLVLDLVHDEEIGLYARLPRRRRVEAEEPRL